MHQLDEFLENADVPQEATQPLTKPLVCPECGCREVEEVRDGLWTITAFAWDEKLEKYKEYDEDTDGCGNRYLQCRNCSDQYPYEMLEQFDMSNPEYRW
jgi:hypothetical protein